ncbi:hypothetical protein AB0M57_06265 [Streptomyces sp. NPDC051597]
MDRIRLLIADDQVVTRSGLTAMTKEPPDSMWPAWCRTWRGS